MIILGGGAVAAAIANWEWWFRLNTARAKIVHDVFGRMFARVLNFVVGIGLLALGIADVSNQLPVSTFMNAWMTDDQSYVEEAVMPEVDGYESTESTSQNTARLPRFDR